MPRTPMNMDPFDVEFGISRVCPRCRIDKSLTPANWTGRWLPRTKEDYLGNITAYQVRAPTTYCRACINLAKRNHRMAASIIEKAPDNVKPQWEAMRRGPCAICGPIANRRSTIARFGTVWVVCSQCKALILEADRSDDGDALAYAKRVSRAMTRHCLDEIRIEREVLERTDLTHVPPHKFNPEAQDRTALSHLVCVTLELSWRKIRLWLEAHQDEQ